MKADRQLEFDRLVPPGEAIGSFNAGIPGYFSSHPIVNLDGLMNNTVYPYYVRRRFDDYLRDARIGYVADENDSLTRGLDFAAQPPKFDVMSQADLPGWGSGRRFLWRVEWPPSGPRLALP